MNDQALVDKLEAVWRSIDELCSSLSEADWNTPTDCPGWTVKDNLSHIIGTESVLLGRPAPEHTPADTGHVRNPIGEANEVQVDYRRSRSPAEVLEEFREVTGERVAQLRSWGEEDFSKESWTPMGQGTIRDFIEIRIFDCWVHEQDIRRALDRPGHLEGPVAEHAFERVASAMPYVIGKKVGPPNGTVVVFDVNGPAGGRVAVGIEGGRGMRLDDVPGEPTVRVETELEAFNALGCGRWDAARAEGRVKIHGDQELGRSVLENLNFMI